MGLSNQRARFSLLLAVSLFGFSLNTVGSVSPNYVHPSAEFTPGLLCSADDPNFDKYDYPEHIARCVRNVGKSEKQAIAKQYGDIPESEWPNYEFDHLIPLCAGGSDDSKNLWPQPIDEAHIKDKLENQICISMRAGKLSQAEAVQKVHDWFEQRVNQVANKSPYLDALKNLSSHEILCQDGHFAVRFTRLPTNSITKLVVELKNSPSAKEVLRLDDVVNGLKNDKQSSLKGDLFYSLSKHGEKDQLQLFLPANLSELKQTFTGHLRSQFEADEASVLALKCEMK